MSNEQRVRRYWESFWSRGDSAAVEKFGLEEAVTWRSHFRDLRAAVDLVVACGDWLVVSRVIYTGTFEAETYRGLSPSGRRIETSGLDVFRFEDDHVVDHWHEADHHTMFAQLGAELRAAE